LHTAINVPELGQDQAFAVKFIFNQLTSAKTMPTIYPRFNQKQSGPDKKEKIVSSLCYLSMGIVGLLYIIFSGRNSQSPFFRFNFLQSIVLWILSWLMGRAQEALVSTLAGIFGLAGALTANILPMITLGISVISGLITSVLYLVILYGCIWAMLGKNVEIPFISKVVRQNMR
jgi:uncharacterized membrane protein